MKWTKELPKVVGHYWFRDLESKHDKEPVVIYVRDYCGELAIVNAALRGSSFAKRGEWAGPIPLPKEAGEPLKEGDTVEIDGEIGVIKMLSSSGKNLCLKEPINGRKLWSVDCATFVK